MKNLPVAILAGGAGARLGLADIPKPMAEVAGKPLLQRQIELARRHGLRDIILLTGHLSEVIENHFGDGSGFGVSVEYFREDVPLGTAGAFAGLRERLGDSRFLVLYGDVAMDFDMNAFIDFDKQHADNLGTLIVHPNDHPHDSDLVEAGADCRVLAFHKKPHPENVWRRNLSNAAVYCLSPEILAFIEPGRSQDWAHDIFPKALAAGKRLHAYNTSEYIKDMGTPERYAAVRRDWEAGVPEQRGRRSRPAVFLDRDGIINYDVGNLSDIDKFVMIPGAAEAVRRINKAGRLAVLVTNQPVVAKGWLDEKGLDRIHAKLETLLGREGAYLDRIYYCPHHPEQGFEGERAELKFHCDCRKPRPGMLLRAQRDLNIDMPRSFLFGDRDVDIMAADAAGVGKSVLLEANRPQALLAAVSNTLAEGEK